MPSTRKQIRANRRNAQKSTGPKSASGKQISSRNATTHGLTGSDIIIQTTAFSENPEDYNQLVKSLCDELKPATPLQEHLVRKIANCVWRSRRAVIAETAHVADSISDVEGDVYAQSRVARCLTSLITEEDEGEPTQEEEDRKRWRLICARMIPSDCSSSSIFHYEMRLDRQLTRAYIMLRRLKGQEYNELRRRRSCRRRLEKRRNRIASKKMQPCVDQIPTPWTPSYPVPVSELPPEDAVITLKQK